jgi:hypothetical protein
MGPEAGHPGRAMITTDEILLCGYEGELGRHELVAKVDERSLTYRVFVRDPNGETRLVREYVPSLRSARQWAIHHAYNQVLALPRVASERALALRRSSHTDPSQVLAAVGPEDAS